MAFSRLTWICFDEGPLTLQTFVFADTNKILNFCLTDSLTIYEVNHKIFSSQGIQIKKFRLYFRGVLLADELLWGECRIPLGHAVMVEVVE